MRSSICLTFIGPQRCRRIHINTDSLQVRQSVQPSLYPFYSQNCLHILSKVFISTCTSRQLTQEVGSYKFQRIFISPNFNLITSINYFHFSTIYTKGKELYFMKEFTSTLKRISSRCPSFFVDNIFVVFAGKVFNRQSVFHGHKLCPSPSRHISVLI